MDLRTKLFLPLAVLATLLLWTVAAFYFRPPAETAPIFAGWAVGSLNFIAAVIVNLRAMRRGFDAFKLILFAGMALRLFLMLLVLMAVVRFLKSWTTPFSASLLLSFGIYIMMEVGYFFLRSRQSKT